MAVWQSHARDAHIVSFPFFIFFAYSTAQNLERTVNTKGNIGTTSLGIMYSSFTLFSVVASPVVRGLGEKRALVLGTIGDLPFIALNLKPSCLSSETLGTVWPLVMATPLGGLAIAPLKLWQSGAIAAVVFLSPHISLQAMLIIMVAVLCVALAGFLYLTLHVEKPSSSESHQVSGSVCKQ